MVFVIGYKLWTRTRWVRAVETDILTGRSEGEGVGWVNENDMDTGGGEKDREREDKKKSLGKKTKANIVG